MQEYQLKSPEAALLGELQSLAADAQAQLRGALTLIIRQNGLEGEWALSGQKLVRSGAPAETSQIAACPSPASPVSAKMQAALMALNRDDLELAIKLGREMIREGTDDASAYNLVASCLGFLGRHEEAIAVCNKAVKKLVGNDTILHERSFHHLLMGNWEQGWQDWEHRNLRVGEHSLTWNMAHTLPDEPEWDGKQSLIGKRLMLVAEGGIGDGILFGRYIRMLKDRGLSRILVVAQKTPIADFFRSVPEVNDSVSGEMPLPYTTDYWVGLWSLPLRLGMMEPLATPMDLGVQWLESRPMAPQGRLRVGISWHGDPEAPAARWRPSDLQDWAPLLAVKDVEFGSLQVGEMPAPCVMQIEPGMSVRETAQRLAGLDLVITCDGMIAHLAGCVKVPTWLVLHNRSFWMWEPKGDRTVWYPTLEVKRRTAAGGWSEMFQRLAGELSGKVAAR